VRGTLISSLVIVAPVASRLMTLIGRPAVRAALANFNWLAIEKGVRLALGLFVGFWVARHLGPDRLGTLAYCTALVTLLTFLPALGLDAVVKRRVLAEAGRTDEILASSLVLRLFGGVLGYVILVGLAAVPGVIGEEERLPMLVLGALLFQPMLMVSDLWLQARLLSRRAVIAQLVALAACAAWRVALIQMSAGVLAFAWATAVEAILGACGVVLAGRGAGLLLRISAATKNTMSGLLREAWPLAFAALAIVLYMRIDEVMLRRMAGVAEVGVYSAATRLSEIWYFIPVALATSMLPALLRARERGAEAYRERQQQYHDLSAAAAYCVALPVSILAPGIVRLAYGEPYVASGPILSVHIWSCLFVFLGISRGQWLVNEGHTRFYLGATVVGAVSNIALNLVLIPRWQGLGAAAATVISYAAASWLCSYLHPVVRAAGSMQTRAILLPLLGWRYLRTS
jgi:PST family polysaccharide transporter